MGSIRGKAHRLPQTHMATVSTPVGRWVKVQGKLKMEAHQIGGVVMDNAAFKVSVSPKFDIDAAALRAARARSSSILGAMERYMRGFDSAQNSLGPATTHRQQ